MRSTLILAIAALPYINALTISKTGQCGAATQLTCKGSTFGSCCSQHNYCGSTSAYCGTGCQSGYGTCGTTTPQVIPAKVSTDGSCGGTKGFTCLNSSFGNCCSQFGYCGKTSAYCASGCNSKFGTCTGSPAPSSAPVSSSVRSSSRSSSTLTRALSTSARSSSTSIRTSSTSTRVPSTSTRVSSTPTRSSSVAAPSSTLKVSTNARCGKGGFEAFTCAASKYGDCCSQYSYCGSTDDYCSPQKNCQAGYGRCGPKPSSSSIGTSTSSSRASSSSTSRSSLASSTAVPTTSSSVFACPSGLVPSVTLVPRQIGAGVISCVPSAISTATPSSSSSTSVSTSASSENPSSSSSVDTTTPIESLTPTSTLATISSALPSACVPTSTNIVINPSFDTGSLAPWTQALYGQWGIVSIMEEDPHSGPYFYAATSSEQTGTINLFQTISVLDGTTVDVSMWIKADAFQSSPTFGLYMDGVVVPGGFATLSVSGWVKIGGQVRLTGDTHDLLIQISGAFIGVGNLVAIDDVYVGVSAPTEGCTVSSSVAVSSSSSSSSVDTTIPTPIETLTPTSTPATTLSSSPSACAPTLTNAVINPSFDTKRLAPWVESISGTWNTAGIVEGESHTGLYYYSATNINGNSGQISLAQTFSVPDDTTVDASMWIRTETLKYSTLFAIFLDDEIVPGTYVTVQSTPWQKIGGQVSLTRGTHKLSVMIYTTSSLGDNMVAIDDIYVGVSVPIEGCSVSTSAGSENPSSSSSVDTTPAETLTPTETPATTTISSLPSACVPTSTNAVINPSFDTGLLAPWTQTRGGGWDTVGIVEGKPHSGLYSYVATSTDFSAALDLYQTVNVPDGTIVNVSLWVKADGTGSSTSVALYLDGVAVPGGSIRLPESDWVKIGGQVQLTGDTHSLFVQIDSSAGQSGNAIAIDDVYIGASVPTEGCAAPSSVPSSSSIQTPSATSSTEPTSSIQSTSSTETPLTTESTKSTSSTETPTPTLTPTPSTSACVPTQTNAIQNSGLESGSLGPFTQTLFGSWSEARVAEGTSHTGTYFYSGVNDGGANSRIVLSQANIPILDGTVVDCSVWVRTNIKTKGQMAVSIYIDNRACGYSSDPSTDYARIGSRLTVVGDVHTFDVVVARNFVLGPSATFTVAVDDVSLIPVSGPGAVEGCPSTTITAPAPPGETI